MSPMAEDTAKCTLSINGEGGKNMNKESHEVYLWRAVLAACSLSAAVRFLRGIFVS